jgi:hypothetical protein
MKFNRAADVSRFKIFRRFLRCLLRDHVWGDWSWRDYLRTEYRICQRCGLIEEQPWFPEPMIGRGMHDDSL